MSNRARLIGGVAVALALTTAGVQNASGLGVYGIKQNDASGFMSISQDAKVVVWESTATNLSPDDTDSVYDVYARNTDTGYTQLVSRATGLGAKGNGASRYPTVSADGRYVAFISQATNLDPADTDTSFDLYVRDLQTQTTVLADRATGVSGAKANAAAFDGVSLSADGRYVAWTTYATNLDAADTDGSVSDVYVRDLQANTTTLVDRATGAPGAKANTGSRNPELSADGRYVAFDSLATNLSPDDPDTTQDVYVRDLQTNTTTLVSRATGATGAKGNGASTIPSISADGRYVSFNSQATNLSPDDTDAASDVYVRDVQASTTTLASRASGAAGVKGNAGSFYDEDHNLSADGRYVSFISNATNLDPADTESFPDMFVRDLQTNTTILASRANGTGANANLAVQTPALSPDGRYAAFMTGSTNLSPDDTDTKGDLYVRDLQANLVYLESRATPSYARPKGATPMRVSLVPAFEPCSSPNATHGAPLAYPSCGSPVPSSAVAMVGPKSISFAIYTVHPGDPSTPANEADVDLDFSVNDIRPPGGTGDYTGEVAVTASLRVTDKSNGPSGHEDGTVADSPFAVTVPCAATIDTTIGGDCALATTANTVVPGLVTESRRTIWDLGQVKVYDGGSDGLASTTGDNTLLADEGVFIP